MGGVLVPSSYLRNQHLRTAYIPLPPGHPDAWGTPLGLERRMYLKDHQDTNHPQLRPAIGPEDSVPWYLDHLHGCDRACVPHGLLFDRMEIWRTEPNPKWCTLAREANQVCWSEVIIKDLERDRQAKGSCCALGQTRPS